MRNTDIADALDELGTLYEIDGAVRYRVIAYRSAASVVRESPTSIAERAVAGTLTELEGIGATLAEKIEALVETGSIPAADKLKETIPPTLVEVTNVPGVGAKTARKLHDELGVASLDDLRKAAEDERIRELKGLGPKAEQNILAGLERVGASDLTVGRVLLSDALEVAETLAGDLRSLEAARAVEIAGSARRFTDTCHDVDLIATADDSAALVEAFTAHDLVDEVASSGEAGASVRTHNGIGVDLRVVEPAAMGNLLQHFTGSKRHNVELRERAQRMGLSVSEHGVTDTESGEIERFATEVEVYERLGLTYIEPELREGGGEIGAAERGELPELLELDDIRGDLHCHTTLSDGHDTLERMAEAARERGYSYLALTDHSATHGFGNDVQPDALRARIEEIAAYNEEHGSRFRLLAGTEANILPDGSLDYEDDLLGELDWVIASVHTSFGIDSREMTERIIHAIENPNVDCIGHLTGRLLLRRDPYELDVERIIESAAEHSTLLEINSNPRRRDLSDRHARMAAEAGVTIVVNTDAHRAESLDLMRYGVATARRAWIEPPQVANTRTWRQLERLLPS